MIRIRSIAIILQFIALNYVLYINLKASAHPVELQSNDVAEDDAKFVCDNKVWRDYRKKYGKFYVDRKENAARMEIFCENLKQFVESNTDPTEPNEIGINHMSDWTKQEIKSLFMDPKNMPKREISRRDLPVAQIDLILERYKKNLADLPDEIDWSKHQNVVGRVKSQGKCGSCWAFGVTGLLEAAQHFYDPKIKYVTELSEQQLVDCVPGDGPCKGNFPDNALFHAKRMGGLVREEEYEYVSNICSHEHKCSFNNTFIHESSNKWHDFLMLEPGNEEDLKKYVGLIGPVLVSIQGTDKLNRFNGRTIFRDPECTRKGYNGDRYLNHAVLIVGYGSKGKEDYWLIKNSWGPGWADNGYAMMARNAQNSCGIASAAIILDHFK